MHSIALNSLEIHLTYYYVITGGFNAMYFMQIKWNLYDKSLCCHRLICYMIPTFRQKRTPAQKHANYNPMDDTYTMKLVGCEGFCDWGAMRYRWREGEGQGGTEKGKTRDMERYRNNQGEYKREKNARTVKKMYFESWVPAKIIQIQSIRFVRISLSFHRTKKKRVNVTAIWLNDGNESIYIPRTSKKHRSERLACSAWG